MMRTSSTRLITGTSISGIICSSQTSIDSGGEDSLVVGEEGIVEGGGDEARREDGAGEDELGAPNIVNSVFCFNGAGFLVLLTAIVDVVVVAGQSVDRSHSNPFVRRPFASGARVHLP